LTTSSIVILSAPAIAGGSLRRVVEHPTIMDATVAGTTLSAIPSEPLLRMKVKLWWRSGLLGGILRCGCG
jgi:hypothetical protein